jgi:hypothetical protein
MSTILPYRLDNFVGAIKFYFNAIYKMFQTK